jgi:hypothetical protein
MPSRSRFALRRGIKASEQPPEEPSPSVEPSAPRRPTILQRLHLSSHSRKKPRPPKLHIERPSTSSSLPVVRSPTEIRATSSHSTDVATINEMTRSLDLGTNAGERKRQRSQDSRKAAKPTSDPKQSTDSARLARKGIRIPAYLSKSKSGKQCYCSRTKLERLISSRNLDRLSRSRMETTFTYCKRPVKCRLAIQG